jgi:hypothetical protein
VLSAVGGIESSGGILEDTIDFMTGIERVVKCTKEGRCGEGKMRSVVWRRGQTIGSTANGKGRVRSANPALLKSRHAKNTHKPATDRSL